MSPASKTTSRTLKEILHKRRVDWFKRFLWISRFRRIDSTLIPDGKNEVRLFMCIRNEALRLPYLFHYYRSIGVDRFFVIDNASTDDSASILLSQKNTHVFSTKESYGNSGCGIRWIRYLLDLYGKNQWCLVVDTDELLIYPHHENCSIKDLCAYLDRNKANGLFTPLLDMYSDKPIRDSVYHSYHDPLSVCSFFDLDPNAARIISEIGANRKREEIYGGMRKRIFNIEACLSKVCLFKYLPTLWVLQGMHAISGCRLSNITGTLLHFKYFSVFNKRVVEEVDRKEHWLDAIEYKGYAEKVGVDPNLNLWYPSSKKFTGSSQLVELGLMKSSEEFNRYVQSLKTAK